MRPRPSRLSRRTRILIPVVVALIFLILAVGWFVGLYADLAWFREVGHSRVFSTILGTKVLLFFLFGLTMAVIVGVNLAVAYVVRPTFRPATLEQQSLDRYRMLVEPRIRLFVGVIAVGIGLITGASARGAWPIWLLWRNGVRFGTTDEQFHRDLSYYAFTYPFQRYVLAFLFTGIFLSLLGALFVHYVFGGVRVQVPQGAERLTAAARAHLSVLLGLFVLCKAGAYWLDRYGTLYSDRSTAGVVGASYTDVHAVLPAKTILLFVALVCAVAFFANVVVRNLMLPAIAFGLLVLSAVLIGGAYPAAVQQFRVRPNANIREAPYITRSITATRAAYALNNVQIANFAAKSTASAAELRADKGTIPNARLLDPSVLTQTFVQRQQVRPVYNFNSKLDVDRYVVDGKVQDVIVGVRELNSAGLQANQRNWINRHLVYTHGYGFVAAPANQVDADGAPLFISGTLTGNESQDQIPVDQPRIYYGELIGDYSIVGKPGGGQNREFDRPAAVGVIGESGDQVSNTYSGKGGVPIGGLFRRMIFAAHFHDGNLLLSNALNAKSKILYIRDPRDRLEKVAPFLKVDGDPYPAVVDGRIVWILDGYTTTDNYPYAKRETLGEVTADSLTNRGVTAQPQTQVNYLRNSIKATVDAYDGTVTLYAFDDRDPLLRAWEKVFPGLIKPESQISDALQAHFRYPSDLLKTQREVLADYHVRDPQTFFSGQAFWSVPEDPTSQGQNRQPQPPYYVTAQLPGQSQSRFQLTTVLNPIHKENLAALIGVSSDPGSYGKITVLQLPSDTAIPGPNQVQKTFTTSTNISKDVTLLDQGGSKVIFGNLLTLPVGGGLLYVEPLYVEGQGSGSQPLLRKVLLAFGDQIAYENTLPQALDSLFGSGAGGGVQTPPGTQPTPAPSPTGTTAPGVTSGQLAAAVTAIDNALQGLRTATQRGDFAAIGQAQKDLADAINAYEQVRKSAAATPSPPPAGARSPAASPKPSP